jgi:Domain of unknown function (DUF4276)
MTALGIAPIVEGHGEVRAIRILLHRMVETFRPDCRLAVLTPIRVSRSRIVHDDRELHRVLDLAALKLRTIEAERKFVLVLLDADQDPACQLGPKLHERARRYRGDVDIACVLPVIEFETWFVAGVATLERFLTAEHHDRIPHDPDVQKAGKGWIQHFFAGPKYSPAVQARLTAAFDVREARQRSRSFAKLCRELERRCAQA